MCCAAIRETEWHNDCDCESSRRHLRESIKILTLSPPADLDSIIIARFIGDRDFKFGFYF